MISKAKVLDFSNSKQLCPTSPSCTSSLISLLLSFPQLLAGPGKKTVRPRHEKIAFVFECESLANIKPPKNKVLLFCASREVAGGTN